MAKRTLAELQAAFSSKTSTANTGNQDWKKFYPFWKMKLDEVAIVRFLPDLDDTNDMGFLVENHVHELNVNGKRETVPCLEMFGQKCPICDASRKFYAEEGDKSVRGKKYYRKKSHIGQVLIVESPIDHDAEQLVKLIEFGPAVFKTIEAAFKDGEMENPPYELKEGYNFKIKKTKNGEYANYSTSSFSGKPTSLDDDLIGQLDLYDLKSFRAKPMDVDALTALFEADLNGASVEAPKTQAPAEKAEAPAETPVRTAAAVQESAPAVTGADEPASNGDYLAQIRARAAAKKLAAEAANAE